MKHSPTDKSYYRKGSQGQCREYYTQPPAPNRIAAKLAALRRMEVKRLAAQPARSKTSRAKVEERQARQEARKVALHPLILEAVIAATAMTCDDAEIWKDGER